MVFSSLTFLFAFFPIFLLSYHAVPKALKNTILFLFSLIFYAWGEPVYVTIMLFSTVFDYVNGLLIEKWEPKTTKSKIVMIVSIIVNLGLLGIFKYYGFVVDTINNVFNTAIQYKALPLPIGISFYTFQTLSYTIDMYRGNTKAQHNIINFGAYVAMFPQLIAGPIVQYKTIAEQLDNRTVTTDKIFAGIQRFMAGFIKKVLLANNIGFVWSDILSNYSNLSSLTIVLGLICYSFQIYFDFSGYSDMAIGLGKMLGFDFLENFNYPYISKSITDFWRRWHISLGSFFREYVYIPLGGNRKGVARQIFNMGVVWALTGIWHGASWNYILWGVYYGILLTLEKFVFGKYIQKLPTVLQHLYALFFVLIGWLLFVIEDMTVMSSIVSAICQFTVRNDILYYLNNYGIMLLICASAATPLYKNIQSSIIAKNQKYEIGTTVATSILFIISLAFLVDSTYNPFLYFRF